MRRKGRSGWQCLPVIVGLVLVAGCSGGVGGGKQPPTPPVKSISLVPFASCDEMAGEIRAILVGEMEREIDASRTRCRYEYRGGRGPDAPQVGSPADGQAQVEERSADATGTNLQEAGVDEADLVKTDGTTAYAIVGDAVWIVRVWPFAQFGKLATIDPEGEPKGLYLDGARLVILSEIGATRDAYGAITAPAKVVEQVYDVSTPSSPRLVEMRRMQGELLESRRIEGNLHLIVSNGVAEPDLDTYPGFEQGDLPICPAEGESEPTEAMIAKMEQRKAAARAVIEALSFAELVPDVDAAALGDCTRTLHSPQAAGLSLVTVVTDDIRSSSDATTPVTILGNGGTLYASPTALYVAASTNPLGWWSLGDDEIEDTTVIHRFALNEGIPAYAGSAEVNGHLVRNDYVGSRSSERFSMAQFAMSEHEGHLRIATTAGVVSKGDDSSESFVTVLSVGGGEMTATGQVGGIGRGEKIHAVRFIGARAYAVTFKKTDPLFVVDLSDPAAPAVAGELHVPGFSTYLHPFDETHLIGLGFDADDEGEFAWTMGLKIALFDVADPANPVEVGHREIGTRGSYSPAVEEHHAFTFDRARGMIALPVDISESGGDDGLWGTFSWAGVMLLKADDTGTFADLGRIATTAADPEPSPDQGVSQSADVLRTVIIGDASTSGVITLTTSQFLLHRIDAAMTPVGVVQ